MSEAVLMDDELEAAQEAQVVQAEERLREVIKAPGVSLVTAVDEVERDMQVSRSVIRQALSRLLYAGSVTLTETRQLVPE